MPSSRGNSRDEFMMDAADFEENISPVGVKSTKQLVQDSVAADALIQTKVNNFRQRLAKEPTTKIRIAPAYKPYLGSKCQVIINGVAIVIPVDGSMVEVPEPYAAEMYRRMAGIDAQIDRMVKMSNYGQNREQVIGEIKF